MEDIEDGIEKYYRHMIADDIDTCLHSTASKDPDEMKQVYWFNQGMMFASMIARWGLGNDYR
jgi:hypothetical protein